MLSRGDRPAIKAAKAAQSETAQPAISSMRSRAFTFVLLRSAVRIVSALILLLLLLRTAWVSEDGYISFRVADNFLSGYGLRWNIADRVQTYTDPLFLALVTLATWISGNLYLSVIVISVLLTLAAFVLITQEADTAGILLATAILLFSKGFMDFSVSGLENPATHLCLAAYLFAYWRRRDPLLLSFLVALAAVNRMDSVLLFLPSLGMVYFQWGRKVWKAALVGWSPLLAWSSFSLFYYGFLFPNTAYAKLNTGIPQRELIAQGLRYYFNAIRWDAVTIFAIATGLAIAYFAREWLLGAGVVLHLMYVVWVGGDFMSARLFTAPLFLCAALVARYWRPRWRYTLAGLAVTSALGMSIPSPTVTSARATFWAPWPVDAAGIADERAYWYAGSGLLRYRRDIPWPVHAVADAQKLRAAPLKVFVIPNIGYIGYYAGPQVHIIDPMALGDAFLARLPCQPGWRIGHFLREIPAGYVETIATGHNRIADPQLAEYYGHLRTVISGDLWSGQRWKEIALLNTGYYDHLLRPYPRPRTAHEFRIGPYRGELTLYAFGDRDVKAVWFNAESVAGRRDGARKYAAVPLGGGTWMAKVDLANHSDTALLQVQAWMADSRGEKVTENFRIYRQAEAWPALVTGIAPTAADAGPSDFVTAGKGDRLLDFYAYDVRNATVVMFAVWSTENGQDDLKWYPGIDLGGGTWKASVNLYSHPGMGQINVHVYLNNGAIQIPFKGMSFTRTND